MIIPSEFIGWFKAGVIVGLDVAFFVWLILEAYWKEIGGGGRRFCRCFHR